MSVASQILADIVNHEVVFISTLAEKYGISLLELKEILSSPEMTGKIRGLTLPVLEVQHYALIADVMEMMKAARDKGDLRSYRILMQRYQGMVAFAEKHYNADRKGEEANTIEDVLRKLADKQRAAYENSAGVKQ